MSLIFSNKPLDLTVSGAVFEVAIPFNNTTLAVYNEQARQLLLTWGEEVRTRQPHLKNSARNCFGSRELYPLSC